jgi:hypothetical protein
MPKSTTFSNDLVALLFNATAIANIADNAAASPLTNLYLSLHTASPGIGGSQLTNETSYTNYVRLAVARTAGGWTVASGAAQNTALAQFAQCGASGATLTHVGIGTDSSGAGKMLYAGALNASLAVSNGIQPQFAALALTCTES